MASKDLTPENAARFFAALYEEDIGKYEFDPNEFDPLVTRIVTRSPEGVSAGEDALQNLIFNYVLSSPDKAKLGRKLTAVMGNIKQRLVQAFSETFPSANLEELIDAANKSGYDVDILKPL